MTKDIQSENKETCPAKALLKQISGKWKPEIFLLAMNGPLRFSSLLRQIEGTNKQSLSVALRDLEEAGLLKKEIISQKPLHIEYHLTEYGTMVIPIFKQLENIT